MRQDLEEIYKDVAIGLSKAVNLLARRYLKDSILKEKVYELSFNFVVNNLPENNDESFDINIFCISLVDPDKKDLNEISETQNSKENNPG